MILALALAASAQMNIQGPSQLDNDLKSASILLRAGEFARARILLDRLTQTYANDARVADMYKQLYREAKLYPELEALVRRELAQSPRDPILLTQLGEARYLQGDEAGADSIWSAAMAGAGKNDDIYRFVADVKLRYGLYDAAIEVYLRGRSALAIPSLFSMELAGIYETQRDYPRAVSEYLVQLAQEPDHIALVSTKIRGLMEDTPESDLIIKTVVDKLKDSPGRNELYEILGDLYIKQGQMDKALESYKTVGVKQKDDGQSLIRFAGRAFDSKAFGAAISAVDEYVKTSKNAALKDLALLIKAKSLQATGQGDQALREFLSLSSLARDARIKDEALLSAGLLYAGEKNNCDSALACWETSLNAARDPFVQNRVRVEMAVCYIKKDELDKAEDLLKAVLSSRGRDISQERSLFLLGDLAFYRGNYGGAGESIKQLIQLYPQGDYTNDALMRLDIIAMAGDDQQAKPDLERFARALRAQVIGDEVTAGLILADSAFASTPIAEQAAFYSAAAFSHGGKSGGAISGFKAYIEKYPEGLYIDRAFLELGDLYRMDPLTYPQARDAYKKILESFPDGPVTELARQRLQSLELPGKIG
jgi:tetratricopeptide (TPR) repeat protein